MTATYTPAIEAALEALFETDPALFEPALVTVRADVEAPHSIAYVLIESAMYCLVDNTERYGVTTYRTPLGAPAKL